MVAGGLAKANEIAMLMSALNDAYSAAANSSSPNFDDMEAAIRSLTVAATAEDVPAFAKPAAAQSLAVIIELRLALAALNIASRPARAVAPRIGYRQVNLVVPFLYRLWHALRKGDHAYQVVPALKLR
jgi:hypothetical protein